MKMRIRGNSIRLRLSQSEVSNFGAQGICYDSISFGGRNLTYQLHKADVDEIKAEFVGDTISIEVPDDLADAWVNDVTQVGFEHHQTLNEDDKLFILIEKDFACLTDRPNEDESDNFPNPMAGEKC